MSADVDILEGFLCPICHKDFGSSNQLTFHFEKFHNVEPKKVVNVGADRLFDKAKKRLLKNITEEVIVNESTSNFVPLNETLSMKYDVNWDPQEIGVSRSHSAFFKNRRDAHVDRYVIETNKIIIRLEKLLKQLQDVQNSPKTLKGIEQTVVTWVDNKDMNLCITCGQRFNFLRRRHHCRLCGGIICKDCSQFLPFTYGRRLIEISRNPQNILAADSSFSNKGFKSSDSVSSLDSLVSTISITAGDGEPVLRTCSHCRDLLERHEKQQELRYYQPEINELYNTLKSRIDSAEQTSLQYCEVCSSLRNGESTYSIEEAVTLYRNLAIMKTSIESICKQIMSYGTDSVTKQDNCSNSVAKQVTSRTERNLQRSLLFYAKSFIQENLMSLSAPPKDSELSQIRENRKIEIQKKIDSERQQYAFQIEEEERITSLSRLPRFSSKQNSPSQILSTSNKKKDSSIQENVFSNDDKNSHIIIGDSWMPSKSNVLPTESSSAVSTNTIVFNSSPNPFGESIEDELGDEAFILLQQIRTMERYKTEAADAKRWDEVKTFKINIDELTAEFKRLTGRTELPVF